MKQHFFFMPFTRAGKIRKAIGRNRVDKAIRPPLLKRNIKSAINWHTKLGRDLTKTLENIKKNKQEIINGKLRKPRMQDFQGTGLVMGTGMTSLSMLTLGSGHPNAAKIQFLVGALFAGSGIFTTSRKLRSEIASLNRLLKTKRLKVAKKEIPLTKAELESNRVLIEDLEHQLNKLAETNSEQMSALQHVRSKY